MKSATRYLACCLAAFLWTACGSDDSAPGSEDTGSVVPDGGSASDGTSTDDDGTLTDDTGGAEDAVADAGDPDTADPDTSVPEDTGPQFTSYMRLIHLSPNAPPINVYIDEEAPAPDSVFDSVGYLETGPAIGDEDAYVEYATDSYDLALVPAGVELADATLRQTANFSPDAHYTVYLFGDYEVPAGQPNGFAFGVAVDDVSTPAPIPSPDGDVPTIRLRAFHAIVGVGTTDFSVNGEVVREDIFFGSFNPDFFPPDAAALPGNETYTLALSDAETGDEVVSFSVPIAPGLTNLFFVGEADGDIQLVTLTQDNQLNLYAP